MKVIRFDHENVVSYEQWGQILALKVIFLEGVICKYLQVLVLEVALAWKSSECGGIKKQQDNNYNNTTSV